MNELIEVYVDNELVVEENNTLIVEGAQGTTLVSTQTETLVVEVPIVQLLEVGTQGPPGPPGSGGGGSTFETILNTDYSNSSYSFVGTATKITKIDYLASPPSISKYVVNDYATDWANRLTLGYS